MFHQTSTRIISSSSGGDWAEHKLTTSATDNQDFFHMKAVNSDCVTDTNVVHRVERTQ